MSLKWTVNSKLSGPSYIYIYIYIYIYMFLSRLSVRWYRDFKINSNYLLPRSALLGWSHTSHECLLGLGHPINVWYFLQPDPFYYSTSYTNAKLVNIWPALHIKRYFHHIAWYVVVIRMYICQPQHTSYYVTVQVFSCTTIQHEINSFVTNV